MKEKKMCVVEKKPLPNKLIKMVLLIGGYRKGNELYTNKKGEVVGFEMWEKDFNDLKNFLT